MTNQAIATRPTTRARMTKREQREAIEGYLFILPWVIGFLIFTAGPMLASLALSFTKWGLIDTPVYIGADNYVKMVNDPLVWHSLGVTARYTLLTVPLQILFSLGIALILVRPIPGVYAYRGIFYLPNILGGVVTALLWMWVFNPDYGILNYLLSLVGIEGPAWLSDPDWALPAIVIMSVWNLGAAIILFIAGLQSIPAHLYEAAELDGAGDWAKFRYVTLPMLSPTLLFILITAMIASFQVFDIAFVASAGDGGPVRSTLVYLLYFYQNGFKYFNMGYASALIWLLMAIVLALTVLIFRSSSMWVFYESEVRR
jgi:multiple sugar transport system permease protein